MSGPLRLTYDLAADDYAAFSADFAERSSYRRAWRLRTGVVAALFLLLAVLAIVRDQRPDLAAAALAAGIAWMLLYPRFARWIYRRHVRRLYEAGDAGAALGRHEAVADADGLAFTGAYGETRIPWSAIARTVRTRRHLFLYTGAFKGAVIPRATISSGDFDAFAEAVAARMPVE